jgi:hypothetical protein
LTGLDTTFRDTLLDAHLALFRALGSSWTAVSITSNLPFQTTGTCVHAYSLRKTTVLGPTTRFSIKTSDFTGLRTAKCTREVAQHRIVRPTGNRVNWTAEILLILAYWMRFVATPNLAANIPERTAATTAWFLAGTFGLSLSHVPEPVHRVHHCPKLAIARSPSA